QSTGWGTIIYMAALSGVDPELHEAALIDGASRLQRVRHIDLPTILPTITITLILRCGSLMGIGFDKVYLLQNSLNLRASEVISTYVYKVGLAADGGDFSYATAIGLFNSLINLLLLATVNLISRRVSETSLW
ncbi:MAG: ABC transporter permease subunit, partial [Clostridia bacterium]